MRGGCGGETKREKRRGSVNVSQEQKFIFVKMLNPEQRNIARSAHLHNVAGWGECINYVE
jgi:hypothetical protein